LEVVTRRSPWTLHRFLNDLHRVYAWLTRLSCFSSGWAKVHTWEQFKEYRMWIFMNLYCHQIFLFIQLMHN